MAGWRHILFRTEPGSLKICRIMLPDFHRNDDELFYGFINEFNSSKIQVVFPIIGSQQQS